ncbi:aspartyl-tRNA synthetase [Atractiella rhizophila]|nr:aspartyl-tRNA synthetase [Atractiella rhizophila]
MSAAAQAQPAATPILGEDGQPLSKNELKKRAKEEEKARKKAEREAKEAAEKAAREAADVDYASQNYGRLPLNQSTEKLSQSRNNISELPETTKDGDRVHLRAYVQNLRSQGAKMKFFTLRQGLSTVQAILTLTPETVSKHMLKFADSTAIESIVYVEGTVQIPKIEINSCTVGNREIIVDKFFIEREAPAQLPFVLEDSIRPETDFEKDDSKFVRVTQHTQLENRVFDLRSPTNQAIFRITSGVTWLFQQFLRQNGFVEIHTPKLQAAATESGASVFEVKYFDGKAFLAQSPQLAKQMCIAGGMERVFEIGPVFRAENSNTHRHLTEFTGLDLEMSFQTHYHECLDLLDNLLKSIFVGLQREYAKEIEVVAKQFPHEKFTWLEETLRLEFKDAIALLREKGYQIGDYDDMNTEQEKALGVIVKEKYGTDYYIIDKFPSAIRPFYTMPDPSNPLLSNSYDIFMRGEEICSGAQRVHDPNLLVEQMKKVGISKEQMKGYVDAFELGAPPHAGAGFGLERITMLFLKLGNIRRTSLFPRDPSRLEP